MTKVRVTLCSTDINLLKEMYETIVHHYCEGEIRE